MSDEIAIARALGAASRNRDWQFAAKHWDRVDDPQSKEELLRLARAIPAPKTRSRPHIDHGGETYHLGQWFERADVYCQLVYISPNHPIAGLEWFKKDGLPHSFNDWPIKDFKANLTPIEEPDWARP